MRILSEVDKAFFYFHGQYKCIFIRILDLALKLAWTSICKNNKRLGFYI